MSQPIIMAPIGQIQPLSCMGSASSPQWDREFQGGLAGIPATATGSPRRRGRPTRGCLLAVTGVTAVTTVPPGDRGLTAKARDFRSPPGRGPGRRRRHGVRGRRQLDATVPADLEAGRPSEPWWDKRTTPWWVAT
ncbi:hypothetical protein GCM10010169_49410 [Micromonospora fulviviridis]|nr:hypothetical protein GCM10010169_49410 [Micromonospora fulviviridis]